MQRTIVDAARLRGFLCVHIRNTLVTRPNGSTFWATPFVGDAGLPDLLLTDGKTLLALELKAKGNKPSTEQIQWVNALDAVPGVIARVVYPEDLEAVLQMLGVTTI